MIIDFRRSGGFAPMPVGCHLDSSLLADEQASELKFLMEQAHALQSQSVVNRQVRDAHIYRLQIDDGGTIVHLVYDQTSLPPAMKPLIDFLLAKSRSLLDD